jgi:D-arabinose 1-dehydrogenase-like Zn-dependent alcohol dehydrogenase
VRGSRSGPWDALAATPDVLSDEDAAPLMCAGVTTFNGLRQSGARPGEAVAVLGLGGLGHLGVQFAAKMGFETIAIARGAEKGDFARDLLDSSHRRNTLSVRVCDGRATEG